MSTARVTSKSPQFRPRRTMFYEGRLIGIAHTPGLFVPQPVPQEGPAMVKEQLPLSKRCLQSPRPPPSVDGEARQ